MAARYYINANGLKIWFRCAYRFFSQIEIEATSDRLGALMHNVCVIIFRMAISQNIKITARHQQLLISSL